MVLKQDDKRQHIKLISLDLDGTLLNSERRLTERNRKALNRATENGVELCVSTGSPYYLIPKDELTGVNIRYAITANGSALYDYQTDKCLYEEGMPNELSKEIIKKLMIYDVHIDCFIDGRGYTSFECMKKVSRLRVSESRKKYLRTNRCIVEDLLDLLKPSDVNIQKITLNFCVDGAGHLVDYNEIYNWLSAQNELCITTGVKDNLEITYKSVDKGNMMERLLEIMQISKDEVVAFGDSLNDQSILQKVGTGVVMGNAMEVLKETARFITSSNDEDGVAVWLEREMEI